MLKITALFPILFAFILNNFVHASTQSPDFLVYKGDTLYLYNLILEEYYSKLDSADHPKLFGFKFRGEMITFNCWRGYNAIYQVDNDSLFLIGIVDCGAVNDFGYQDVREESNKRIVAIFGDQFIHNRVFLNWYSGYLKISNGNLMRADMLFGVIYDNEIHIEIKNGTINNIRNICNYYDDPNKINRKTFDELRNSVFEVISKNKWNGVSDLKCGDAYQVRINSSGKIDSVARMAWQEDNLRLRKALGYDKYYKCNDIFRELVKDLNFDIICDDGEPISEVLIIEIDVSDDGVVSKTYFEPKKK